MSCCGQHRHDTTPDHHADATAGCGHHEAEHDQPRQGSCCGAGARATEPDHPTEPATPSS